MSTYYILRIYTQDYKLLSELVRLDKTAHNYADSFLCTKSQTIKFLYQTETVNNLQRKQFVC